MAISDDNHQLTQQNQIANKMFLQTNIHKKSYSAIKEWMDFRASHGENITGESWIMRDTWQKTNVMYGHRIGLAQYPKQFKSDGIKTLIKRAWRYF